MTVRGVAPPMREGAEAVICASTGNTAASAAAYAARAGLRGAVIVPEGKIATGKLAQALMHGARVIALRGNFDEALALVRELAERHPIALVNSVNPFRIEGQKTARLRGLRRARRAARRALHPGRQRRQHHRLLEGLPGVRARRPRLLRLPGRGRGAARARRAGREPGDGRVGDPDRQPGPLGGGDGRVHRARAAQVARRLRRQILDAYRCSAPSEGVFCEPASAASVAGLLDATAPRRRPVVVRAHRPRPQGPADRARTAPRRSSRASRTSSAVERAVLGMRRARERAGSSACRRPRPTSGRAIDVLAAALSLHLELEVEETGEFSVTPTCPASPADRSNLCVRAFETPASGRRHRPSTIRSRDPACRRPRLERGRDRRRPGRRRPHLRARTPTLLDLARRARGPPRQRGRRALRRLRDLRGAGEAPVRFDPPAGLEGVLGDPGPARCRPPRRAPRCRREVPLADAVHNVGARRPARARSRARRPRA